MPLKIRRKPALQPIKEPVPSVQMGPWVGISDIETHRKLQAQVSGRHEAWRVLARMTGLFVAMEKGISWASRHVQFQTIGSLPKQLYSFFLAAKD